MLIEIQKRKCNACGKEFIYMKGGFILRKPKCPHCGSSSTTKVSGHPA